MNRETQELHELLKKVVLPDGWICEKGWPWREATHFVAPKREGGVIIKHRRVYIQLPSSGPASPTVDITDGNEHYFKGRGWRDRIVEAARRAVKAYGLINGPRSHFMNWQDL